MADSARRKRKKKKNGRKLILINPRFQVTYLLFTLGTTVAVVAAFYGANIYFFGRFEEIGDLLQLPPGHAFFQFIKRQREVMDTIFLVTSSVVFLVSLIAGLVFSHRVAGPLYRFQQHLQQIISGSPISEVQFREKDFFREVAETFNQFVAVVNKKIRPR